ncbi:hypothetical protein DM01DRAFT_1126440 [Hesseltinella vesiculosa]|uniref:Prolyl endopeptidase n=1 Tax=Hesseltinella vesiculosa TaxID=101127 RepID=A0A1X2GUD1_9FUNG|nr:hypothetical protein DM01DRAFT_1126440 [Hesseltinella vesiculosa]
MNVTIRKVLLSPDHTIFAYNTEREGMEYGDLHFKDLHNRQDWEGEILQDVFNFVWANDQTVFYTMANEQLRPCKVYAHRIGTEQSEDVLVYDEHDETAFVDITSTKDSKFVTINSNSLSSSEIRVVDASYIPNTASITPSLTLIEPRQPGLEYYVDHHHDAFYILTNAHGATNFKLMKAQNHAIGMPHWQDIITLEPTDKIDDVDLFQDHIIVYGRRDGLPMVLCYNITDQSTHQIPLPSSCCVVAPGSNLDFTTHQVRFSITSPLSHEATYEYDMVERQLKCIRSQAIQSFDKQNYTCSQIHVESHDGQRIPVTLIHPKNLSRTGRNPILMRSYGAYGNNTDPDFRIEHFPLLERGWTIALAHVRGGGELGRQWYEDGKLDKKLNSFKDFISVAKFLGQDSQWSSPEKIAALGTSAGGLLVGGMAHLAPQLFKALVLRVPFVDPLSAMLNPSLPLTSVEVPEWGDPLQDAPAYDWIMQYSPYDNVAQVARGSRLPAMYVTAGMKDQRVLYWQPLKFVARLRHHHQDLLTSPVLLNIDLDHGHFGGHSEQDVRLSEAASQVTFLISQLQQTL